MLWVVTDDIYTETWRRLLEYSNFDFVRDRIAQKHGASAGSSDQENRSKQARQARVCVLQAKEYFDATQQSSLFTSPNHAYYGAVSLASLLLLILGDGTKSLDYLRSEKKNRHHGLQMSSGATSTTSTKGTTLLEETRVEILEFGHFANLYKVLPDRGSQHVLVSRSGISTTSIGYEVCGGFSVPNFSKLIGTKTSLIDSMKFLPDLDAELVLARHAPVRSRSTHEINISRERQVTHSWTLHNCRTLAERDALLDHFRVPPRFSDVMTCIEAERGNAAIVSFSYLETRDSDFHLSWPTSRETLNHDSISYADSPDTHELIEIYLVAYQLSMLSRYYPDLWVSCIDSHSRGAKLIERAVELIIKKLPLLALSMLGGEDVVISTHREPWKN